MLKHFPDYNELDTVPQLQERSSVLPLGLELNRLDRQRPADGRTGPALLLWNHRWEYDKNPGAFFRALYALQERGVDFLVAVLGEHFVRAPSVFEQARERLGRRIVQFGYAESRTEYARWLWRADIAVSTAIHDFFGAAVVEAVHCNSWPILPRRLTYPELLPPVAHNECLYEEGELVGALAWAIENVGTLRRRMADGHPLQEHVARYDWSRMAPVYDARMDELRAAADGASVTEGGSSATESV
jgi:glycosyltransferase involved in cell wall biosynthesis